MSKLNYILGFLYRYLVIQIIIIIRYSSLPTVAEALTFCQTTGRTLLFKSDSLEGSLDRGYSINRSLYFNIATSNKGGLIPRQWKKTSFNAITQPSGSDYQSAPATTQNSNTASSKNSANDNSVRNSTSIRTSSTTASTAQKQRLLSVHQPTPLGKWEYIRGNYVLRPSAFNNDPTESQPKAVIHFLGGAMIGAGKFIAWICN
jgi:hypothetical protein